MTADENRRQTGLCAVGSRCVLQLCHWWAVEWKKPNNKTLELKVEREHECRPSFLLHTLGPSLLASFLSEWHFCNDPVWAPRGPASISSWAYCTPQAERMPDVPHIYIGPLNVNTDNSAWWGEEASCRLFCCVRSPGGRFQAHQRFVRHTLFASAMDVADLWVKHHSI